MRTVYGRAEGFMLGIHGRYSEIIISQSDKTATLNSGSWWKEEMEEEEIEEEEEEEEEEKEIDGGSGKAR